MARLHFGRDVEPPSEIPPPIRVLIVVVLILVAFGIVVACTPAARAGKADRPLAERNALQLGCSIATIDIDQTVYVDWQCVEKEAADWPNLNAAAGFAVILKAVRDGKAKAK